MTVALEGVQTTLEPMTPDRRVMWERVETSGGVLYASPGCAKNVIDKVIDLSHRDMFETDHDQAQFNFDPFVSAVGAQKLGAGEYGLVVDIDGTAYKKVIPPMHDDCMTGLSGLKVNISLATGLKEIPQLDNAPQRTARGNRPFKITAPDYFAAYIPYRNIDFSRTERPDQSGTVFAMSSEEGIQPPRYADFPLYADRHKRMVDAITHCGLGVEYASFDDKSDNYLLRITDDNSRLHIVALDAYAKKNLSPLFQ